MNNQFKTWPILRDVIIVTVLSFLGGFIVGFASTDHSSRLYFYSLSLSNSLFLVIGFIISGSLAVGNRWRHLAIVAAITWAVSIFNVIFFGFPIIMWMASVIAVAIFALIGGGISLLFKKHTIGEKNLNQTQGAHPKAEEIFINTSDERFYEEVAREMQEKPLSAGLWTKAFSEMGGDDAKARALYIKYRVAQLAEANRQRLEEERLSKKRNEEQKRAAKEGAERRERTTFHRIIHTIIGFITGLLTICFALFGVGLIGVSFTEHSDDFTGEILGGVFLLIIAFLFALATRHCSRETK
jgi:hypothetical protein